MHPSALAPADPVGPAAHAAPAAAEPSSLSPSSRMPNAQCRVAAPPPHTPHPQPHPQPSPAPLGPPPSALLASAKALALSTLTDIVRDTELSERERRLAATAILRFAAAVEPKLSLNTDEPNPPIEIDIDGMSIDDDGPDDDDPHDDDRTDRGEVAHHDPVNAPAPRRGGHTLNADRTLSTDPTGADPRADLRADHASDRRADHPPRPAADDPPFHLTGEARRLPGEALRLPSDPLTHPRRVAIRFRTTPPDPRFHARTHPRSPADERT